MKIATVSPSEFLRIVMIIWSFSLRYFLSIPNIINEMMYVVGYDFSYMLVHFARDGVNLGDFVSFVGFIPLRTSLSLRSGGSSVLS